MGLLLKLAWRNVWRHRRRTLITASAMAVGIALCLGTVAISDGMYARLFDILVRQQIGHVQVHDPEFPARRALHETIPNARALRQRLASLPQSTAVSARVYGHALLGTEKEATGAQLVGVQPEEERPITGLEDNLIRGRGLSQRPEHGILLGAGLADELDVDLGDQVVAVTQAADGSLGNDAYTVVGIFRTGSAALDRAGAYLHVRDLQDLLALGDEVHELALLAPSPDDVPALTSAVRDATGDRGLLVRSWREVSPMAVQMLQVQEVAVWVLVIIVFGVAVLGILNTMLMSVFERTKELGVSIALGLRPVQVLLLILLETVALAGVSILIGGALGAALDAWLVWRGLDFSGMTGGFDYAGVQFDPLVYGVVRVDRIVVILGSVVVVSLLAALWPAWRAARLPPVVAMREGG